MVAASFWLHNEKPQLSVSHCFRMLFQLFVFGDICCVEADCLRLEAGELLARFVSQTGEFCLDCWGYCVFFTVDCAYGNARWLVVDFHDA